MDYLRLPLALIGLFLLGIPAWGQTSASWQQHVEYDMDVTLLADRHQMRGTQRLAYTNNSPDTLHRVYYHLYFNAFNPNSMMAERNRHLPDPDSRIVPRIFNLGPEEIGYHRIQSLTQNGEPVEYEITDTVVRVNLANPILPGETTVFRMRFRSQVPLQTRRSGRDNREGIDYSMTQWYPKIAEYDERGWHADPYVGREFYAPYGTFDVRITLPATYTLGATGTLQNPDEIGHGYAGPGTYRPAEQSAEASDSLTWHFHAEHVHDFAWAADPDYIHEHFVKSDQSYHLLYQPGVEERWEPMSEWVPDIVEFFNAEYGPYPYPQFTVAQGGDGGMEYPMIVLITGRRSPNSLLGVTAHEAAHEWFYGTLGTNEADYAWMDEGFTSYATTESVAHVQGRNDPSHTGARLSVLRLKDQGRLERFNTPADWFATNVAYGVASYPGGEMFVDMMSYVISDSLQERWLYAYYNRFTFRHPNPYDLEKIAEDVSGLRLDWYFEQFLNTTRTLDYGIEELETTSTGDGWETTVVMQREAEIAMPIDLKLTYADGSVQWVNVPLGIMQGHKPVPDSWIVAEPWPWTFPTYTFEAALPKRVVEAEIDPKGMMPDANRLDNTANFPLEANFFAPVQSDWFHYSLGWRPLAQYADNFGVGAGLRAEGQYLFGDYRLKAMLKLWPQVLLSNGEEPELNSVTASPDHSICQARNLQNETICDADVSWFDGLDYELRYQREVEAFGEEALVGLSAEKHLGILENQLSLTRPLDEYGSEVEQQLGVSFTHQFTPTERVFPAASSAFGTDLEYPTLFNENHFLTTRLSYTIADGPDYLKAFAEVGGSVGNGLEASHSEALRTTRFSVEAAKTAQLGPLRGEAAFHLGMGAPDLSPHKRFRLGAASLEERWRNDAFRSVAAAFDVPREEAHLVAFDRPGPVAYLLSGLDGDPDEFTPLNGFPPARNIVQGQLSASVAPFSNVWLNPFRVEAFSGAGTVWNKSGIGEYFFLFDDSDDLGRLIADAGLGASYDVSQLEPLRYATRQSDVLSGMKLVAKFPVWVSDPELIDTDQDAFAFRWLIGIQTGL